MGKLESSYSTEISMGAVSDIRKQLSIGAVCELESGYHTFLVKSTGQQSPTLLRSQTVRQGWSIWCNLVEM